MRFLLIFGLTVSCFGQWTFYNRTGAIHNENDCYLPSLVSFSPSQATLTTKKQSSSCEAIDQNGWIWSPSQLQSYETAGLQWTDFSFQYGTVEVKATLPNSSTNLWPAIWLLSANCQKQQIYIDYIGNGCPLVSDNAYEEIDLLECGGPVSWCSFHIFAKGTNNSCSNPVNDNNSHVWNLTWLSTGVTLKKDGTTVCTISSPLVNTGPMFLIMQTQVTSPNDSYLPDSFKISYVKVTDLNSNVIFFDNFARTLN